MPAKHKTLSGLFRAAIQNTTHAAKKPTESIDRPTITAFKLTASADDSCLKDSISGCLSNLNVSGELDGRLSRKIASSLHGSSDVPNVEKFDSEEACNLSSENHLFSLTLFEAQNRATVSRERKRRWILKNTQDVRFRRLIQFCGEKLGAYDAVEFLSKLGRETGVKEYDSLIRICIEEAKKSEDEETLLEHMYRAFELFKLMKERGFQIDEQIYGPVLNVLIEMHMVDEFFFLLDIVRDENPSINSRFGYYEMLLAIEVNDETKIQELSDQIASDDIDSTLQEQYLMALCDRDREKELLEVLERIDITQISSVKNLSCIFSSLGRLSLESFAVQFILRLKDCDQSSESIPILIADYATSIRNLAVEEVVSKFKSMHTDLELIPSSLSWEKVIKFCCKSLEAHEALNVANQMLEAGLTLSVETLNCMLRAFEESCESHLVHHIISMLHRFNLKSDSETYRNMINLCVRSKDFKGAYSLLGELEKVNISPTPSMYNAMMAGFYREKNVSSALKVLEKMKAANVKPDSQTFSYLIGNSDSEEDIIKYYKELKSSGIQVTKHIFMALINAYANSGQFEEAKQVVLDKRIEVKEVNEVKSVLISALASHGHMRDALVLYEDMKLHGNTPEAKAIIALIEHLQSSEELCTMRQLVDELSDSNYWIEGCFRVIRYCVRNKHLRDAVDLLDELISKVNDDICLIESVINEMFKEVVDIELPDVQFGLDLLHCIKDELMLQPSRRCLDFLLGACVITKDSQSARLIWEEYPEARLPYNAFGFLRMYQVFLASGDKKSANKMLKQLQVDDPHVGYFIRACRVAYTISREKNKKKVKQH